MHTWDRSNFSSCFGCCFFLFLILHSLEFEFALLLFWKLFKYINFTDAHTTYFNAHPLYALLTFDGCLYKLNPRRSEIDRCRRCVGSVHVADQFCQTIFPFDVWLFLKYNSPFWSIPNSKRSSINQSYILRPTYRNSSESVTHHGNQ